MDDKDILILESLGYKLSEQGAIIDKDGNFVPQVTYNGRNIVSPASMQEYENELKQRQYLNDIKFSANEDSPEPRPVQENIAIAQKEIEKFEKNPLYASIPKDGTGTPYEEAYNKFKQEKQEKGEFVHDSLEGMYENLEDPTYKEIEDDAQRERLKEVDRRRAEIMSLDPDYDLQLSNSSDESKGYIISSLGGMPTVVKTPTKDSSIFEKGAFWIQDTANDILNGIISTVTPSGSGMKDEKLQKEYEALNEERREIIKPIAAKRIAEIEVLEEELNQKLKETDYWSTEYDKYAYASQVLDKQKRNVENFIDDTKWYELNTHLGNIFNVTNVADWMSLGLYDAYAKTKYEAGLRDRINNGEQDEADIFLGKALAKQAEVEQNNFQQNFTTEVVTGLNESFKFLGFGGFGRRVGRGLSKEVAKAGGNTMAQAATSTAAQVLLHPQTYSNAMDYYAGDFTVQTNENGETEILTTDRNYYNQKRENQFNLEELDKKIAETTHVGERQELQRRRKELVEFDKALKEPATYGDAAIYGITEMLKEILAENYGGKLYNAIGGKKVQNVLKNSKLGKALMKIPGVQGLNKMSSRGKDFFNKKFGGVPGEKVIGSNTEEIFEEMLVQLTPTYGNTMEENLDQAGELLTLDFYAKVAAQTLLMQKTMALANTPQRVKSFFNKDERAKRKDLKELYKKIGSRNLSQEDFNKAMMKVGEGNFSIQEYNNEIKAMKEAGLINEANELERTKIIKQALIAERSGTLSQFKKAMTKAKYNKNLSPETIMNIESLIPEINEMLDTPYINRSEIINLKSKERFANKSLNEIERKLTDFNITELNKEFDKRFRTKSNEAWTLDEALNSNDDTVKDFLINNFEKFSTEFQQYAILNSQLQSSKDVVEKLNNEIKKKTSAKHQMKLELEQDYMKYLNTVNKQMFSGKITPSQFKKLIDVKGVKNRTKGIPQEDIDRIHNTVIQQLEDELNSKIQSTKEPTEEDAKKAPIPPRQQNTVNVLSNVAIDNAQQKPKPSDDVIDDDTLDFLPASENTTNEMKNWANVFEAEEGRKATFQDYFNDAVEQVGKNAITRDVLETLGDAYEKAGLGKSNWEKIYKDNYVDRKSITRSILENAINDNADTVNKESQIENKKIAEQQSKEEQQGIDPFTGDIIRVTPVAGKTNIVTAKANYRGLVYKDTYSQDGNIITVNKENENSIPVLNEDGIVDVKELLHPDKNNPGTIWDIEVLDDTQWSTVTVSVDDSIRKFISFSDWVEQNKPANMSIDEFKKTDLFIGKVPILYKSNDNIVSVVPDIDWYNPYNIKDPNKEITDIQSIDNPSPSHIALINKGKSNTLELRKGILDGTIKNVEVLTKSGSPIDFYPVGTQLPYLNQVGTTYPIVFMKGDQLVDLEGNNIIDDTIEVTNFSKMKTEASKDPGKTNRVKILIPVNTTDGKKKYTAYNVMGLNENGESQAFTEDAETAKFITAAHLRLQFGEDVTALKGSTFELSVAEAKSIQSQIKDQTGLDISNFNTATELVKALVIFQHNGRKYGIDKTIEVNGRPTKITTLMFKGEGKFIQNTSLSSERKKTPLSIKRVEGQIKVDKIGENYEDYLRQRLSTEIIHHNVGTEENPAWTAHMQPIIKLRPIETEAVKSVDFGETGNSVKEEAREILDKNKQREKYGLEPLAPTYRGTSLEEWNNIKNGEIASSDNMQEATWVSDKKEYSEEYVNSKEGTVLIEFKPEAIDKSSVESGQQNDNTGVRIGRGLKLEDVQKVTDSKGNVLYEAPTNKTSDSKEVQEAKEILGDTSELTEDERKIIEDAEKYLRDMGMIDSDENSDDLLPLINSVAPIEGALKNVGNLTLAQQRDITSYILSIVSQNYDFSKELSSRDFSELVKNNFYTTMKSKLDETLATIENLVVIQQKAPSERINSVISQLEITADTLRTVYDNYNTFFSKAYLEGMRKGFIPSSVKTSDELNLELKDNIQEEMYEKDYSKSSNEVIHKDKISKKLKRLFATISTGKKGFLGLPKHESYDVMYNTISALIVSDFPTNPDFNSMIEKLELYQDSFPWLNSFITEIRKSEDDIKNAFTYNMYKYAAKAKFVIFTRHNDGINSEIWDSNANNIRRKIRESWNNNFKRSNITNGSTLNTKKLESLWNEFESWGDEPWTQSDKVLRNWLSEFGIKVSNRTWDDIKAGKMVVGKGKNKTTLGFDALFFKGGDNRGNRLFSNLALFAKQYKDKEQGSLDYIQNANLHPYKDMGSILPSLIAIEATYNSEMKSMTRRDGGKTVSEIIFPTFFFHNIAKLKRDSKTDDQAYIKLLQSIPFSSNSVTLDLLLNNDEFKDIFDYAEVGLQSLDEQFKKSNPFGKIDQLSPIDYMFHQRNQFQYMRTEKLDAQHNGFDMRVGTMATLTNSDKGRMMLKKTAVYDLFRSDAFIVQDNGSIKFSDQLKTLLYNQLIEPELNRIVNHVESDIKDYDKGAVRFNLIPEINNILSKNNISVIDFLRENKDKEMFQELFYDNIVTYLENSIINEANSNVSEISGFINNNTDMFNNKEYIADTRRKGSVTEKMMIAELDFLINSMVANMDTLQTISGDPAMFYKGPASDMIGELQASKDLGVNLGKRMAIMIAPGSVLANSTNETYMQLFLEDQEEVAQNAEEIIGWHYGKASLKEEYNGKTYQEHINDLRNKTISKENLSQLQLKFDKVKSFLQIETTDAQEYTTLKEHLRVLEGAGRITEQQRKDIIEKVANDKSLSKDDIDLVLQPVKPVYTGDIIEPEIKNDKGEVIRSAKRRIVYIKSSSFPLIPDLVNGTKLEPLMRKMNEMEEEYNTTVRASYQSANKVGAVKNAINPFDNESLSQADRIDPETNEMKHSLVLDRINFKIQQDVPFKSDYQNEDHVSMGTQIFKLLFGDGITGEKGFYLNGQEMSGEELRNEFFKTFSSMINIQKGKLLDNLGLDNNYNTLDPKNTAKKIQELLVAEAEERGFSENDMKSLELQQKTIAGKEVYHFKLPLWFSGNSNKFESMLNAIINNKMFKQKIPGNSFVVGSEAGITLREGIENIKDNKILHIGNYKGGELKGNEVLAPSKVKLNGKIVNLFEKDKSGTYKYIIETENGFELNPEKIDPQLFENFVFRTPTSSHGSGSTIKIVGFLPDVMGDLMITPKNFVTQMGQDFDIDKLTAYQFYHTVGENGRIEKLNESHKEKAVNELRKRLTDELESQGAMPGNVGISLSFLDSLLLENENKESVRDTAFGLTREEFIEILEIENQDIEDIVNRLEKTFDLKIAKNEFIAIHNAVYSNQSASVQSKINKVLSMEFAENQANGIETLNNDTKNETGFNILSPTYQMEKMISGSVGEDAIGIYAKGVTFNSMVQQNDSPIILLGQDENAEPVRKKIRIGDVESDGTLGRLKTIPIDGANEVEKFFSRKIAEAQDERVNTATDNEKAQILGRVGITNLTAVAVDNLLSLLGIDIEVREIQKNEYQETNPFHKKGIFNGKEVYVEQYSLPYLLHSQPIIKEYFKRLRNGSGIINEYNNSLEEDIINELLGDYKHIENAERSFTGRRLAEEISNNNYVSDFQKEILLTYLDLIKDSKKLKNLQGIVDLSNLGKSMWESKEKIQSFLALRDNEDFENATSLLGEFSDVEGEIYLGDDTFFTPTTNQGVMVGNAISLARNLFYNYFPYYDPYISKTIDSIVKNTGNTGNPIEFQEEIFAEMKKYITAASRNGLFLDTPSNERRSMFIDTDTNISLSSYISMLLNEDRKEFKAGLDMVQNNSFLTFMSYEKGENGKPSLIRFNNTDVTDSEENFYDDFKELFIKDYPLPDRNGQPYSTQKLAQELVAYSHLSGGIIREAIEFHRFIPIEYYDAITDKSRGVSVTRLLQNYDTMVDNWDDRKRLQNFEKQFFQNNPERAVQFPKAFRNQNIKVEGNKLYINKSMEQYPKYVSIKNSTKSKLKQDKWSLYKNIGGHVYQEIDVLGEFGMAEYDYNSSNLTSIISKTPKTESTPTPSITPTPKETGFSLTNSDTPQDILTKISNNSFDYNHTLPGIATELLKLFPEQLNNVKVKIVNDINLPIRGRYGNKIITLNMAQPRSAETFIHEFIHSLSSDYLNSYYERNDKGNFLTDANGQLILKSALPAEVNNLNILANEFKNAIQKAYPEEFDAFTKKYKLHRSGTPQRFTNRETSLFYPTVNLKEFLAVSLSNNVDFLKEASQIPYKQSGMSVLEKFAKLLNQILSKISGIKNNLAEQILNQSLQTLVEINKPKTNQIITGQELMDMDSKIKNEIKEEITNENKPLNTNREHRIFSMRRNEIAYTNDQVIALNMVTDFLDSNDNFMLLAGYAGTGKTTIAENIQNYTNGIVSAPTNAAVQRLRDKLETPMNEEKFLTLHQLLYGEPDEVTGEFTNPKMPGNTVVVVDEASMIDKTILNDIITKAREVNTKIIFMGDSFQLEPVGENPHLLDKFNLGKYQTELSEVKRTDGDILKIATHMRTIKAPEVLDITSDEFSLTDSSKEEVLDDIKNDREFVILTTTNKERMNYNNFVRGQKFGNQASNYVNEGEKVIGIANNKHMNSETFTMTNVKENKVFKAKINKGGIMKEYTFVDVSFVDPITNKPGHAILVPDYDGPSLYGQELREYPEFSEYTYYDNRGRLKWDTNIDIATYGYSTTIHKSQGNEWDNVYVTLPWMSDNWHHGKMVYTAITRGKKKVRVTKNKYTKVVPNRDVFKNDITEMNTDDDFLNGLNQNINYEMINGMPFSEELLNNIKNGTQSITIRKPEFNHPSGIYTINGEKYQVTKINNKPISLKELTNKGKTIKQIENAFKSVPYQQLNESSIKDWFEGKNEKLVYHIKKLSDVTEMGFEDGPTLDLLISNLPDCI